MHIESRDVVLDVGAGDGDGLIAFGAMSLVGKSGRIIFCDVSEDLLDHCRAAARELAVADRAEFVRAAAEDLSPIPDGSVDVVTEPSRCAQEGREGLYGSVSAHKNTGASDKPLAMSLRMR